MLFLRQLGAVVLILLGYGVFASVFVPILLIPEDFWGVIGAALWVLIAAIGWVVFSVSPMFNFPTKKNPKPSLFNLKNIEF